jgi:antiviral helicase SLH1
MFYSYPSVSLLMHDIPHRSTLLATKLKDAWALVVSPTRSGSKEVTLDLRRLSASLGISVDLVDAASIFSDVKGKVVRVITAADLILTFARRWRQDVTGGLRIVVLENLELLDPTFELAIAELRHSTCTSMTRFIGVSDSLTNPTDLAAWLDVHPFALHSFRPRDRDQALSPHFQSFSIPQPSALLKAMAKPAHAAIRAAAGNEIALVFAPSRAQCELAARYLNTQATLEDPTGRGYLPSSISDDQLEYCRVMLQDKSLYDHISRGIGFFHDGIHKADRKLMLDLCVDGSLRVLVVPREACRSIRIRAGVVVVMGTQYTQHDPVTKERRTLDYSLQDIVYMQGRAVRHGRSGHFHLFCHAESRDTYARFLEEGLPLESKLLETSDLEHWYKTRRQSRIIPDKEQAVKALSWTFLARRITSNPAYYDAGLESRDENLSRIVDRLDAPASKEQ